MKPDSEQKTGLKHEKENGAYAFRQRVGSKEIHRIIDKLLEIIEDPEAANKDKISASDKLLKYVVALPRQDVDITSGGNGITGYTFKVVRPEQDDKGN